LLGVHREGIVTNGVGVPDENGNDGLTFIRGGALNGEETTGGLASNGIIPLL
jgi:hypothetical protein